LLPPSCLDAFCLFPYSYSFVNFFRPIKVRNSRYPQVIFVPFYRLVPAPALLAVLLALPAYALIPVAGRSGMVASSEPLASQAGVEILRTGGNAVDAAVAVGFTLAVTFPQAGNLGGGGFMLIRMANGDAMVVDYREQAPAAATRAMYQDAQGNLIPGASTLGARAAGIPGTVMGLALAEEKYGHLGLARVMAPAIRLARNGFPVSYSLAQHFRTERALLEKFDGSRHIFLHDGNLYEPGAVFRQPDLARTLAAIAKRGPQAFYSGAAAQALVATMRKYNGLISREDLEHYQAKLRPPLVGHFRGFDILSVPPPSAGGTMLIEMLNVLEPLDWGATNSYPAIQLLAETMRRAYADRASYMGDADFTSVPVAGLTSPRYAAQLRAEILAARPEAPVRPGEPQVFESGATTHFSVVDAEGDAVANTYTLNGWFGSGVTVEGAGFLLNNEMDDFTAKPGSPNLFGLVQGEANAIAPHKRPLSSMTPTVVTRDGKVRLVLGSPGGSTITNTVLQVLLNVLVYKMDVLQAVTSPRFHDQWTPDLLTFEQVGFSSDTLGKLQQAGYPVDFRESIGDCEAIEVSPESGWRFGASDPRADGKAVGY
jgi:gamma-glutamyltranspeptidase / glutathione hydrolase